MLLSSFGMCPGPTFFSHRVGLELCLHIWVWMIQITKMDSYLGTPRSQGFLVARELLLLRPMLFSAALVRSLCLDDAIVYPQWGWRHEPPVSCESARKVHDTTQPGQWCDDQVRRTSWLEIWQQAGGLAGALKILGSLSTKNNGKK